MSRDIRSRNWHWTVPQSSWNADSSMREKVHFSLILPDWMTLTILSGFFPVTPFGNLNINVHATIYSYEQGWSVQNSCVKIYALKRVVKDKSIPSDASDFKSARMMKKTLVKPSCLRTVNVHAFIPVRDHFAKTLILHPWGWCSITLSWFSFLWKWCGSTCFVHSTDVLVIGLV